MLLALIALFLIAAVVLGVGVSPLWLLLLFIVLLLIVYGSSGTRRLW